MQRIATAMTTMIIMMITMSMTMLLPLAAVFQLLVRRSRYTSLAFCERSKQMFQRMNAKLKQQHNEIHGMLGTFAKTHTHTHTHKKISKNMKKTLKQLLFTKTTQHSRFSGS